jgi:prolycopene isomerase
MHRNFGSGLISRRDFIGMMAAVGAGMSTQWGWAKDLAAGVEGKDDFPVVVIGAGLGGLSAAAILARNSFPVTVVEQHDNAGGYATTFDRAAGKYTFEVSLHATGGADTSLRPIMEATGILGKVETVKLPELCRLVYPEHDITWLHNPDAVIEDMVRLFPGDAQGIRGFFSEIMGILDEANIPFDPDSRDAGASFADTHKKMWAARNMTLADLLNKYVRDPKAYGLLSTYCGYYGLPPSRLSGFFYAVATAGYLRSGGHVIKRRSQDLSDALSASITAAGGKVMLTTEAEGIEMRGGDITGVRLSGGEVLKAKAVISNASVPATMKMLPPSVVPADYQQQLNGYRPSISTFVVWLGLNGNIREKIKNYEIFFHRDYNPEKSFAASQACDPTNSSLGVTVYDNAYDGYSKPGTSTVSILMLSGYEPWRRFEADYFAGRKDQYRKEKERIAATVVKETERLVIPGLSSMVEVMEISTPLTNVCYTKNPEGAIYGYEQSLENSFMNRLKNRTPIKGLYLSSAWTNPGGGFQPCLKSGALACKELVKDWKGKA